MLHKTVDPDYYCFKPHYLENPASLIDPAKVTSTLTTPEKNNLFQYLSGLLDDQKTRDLFALYQIGTSNHWPGATLFWRTGQDGKTRTGKVVLFDPHTGILHQSRDNKPIWVDKLWQLHRFNRRPCLFGEHLLTANPSATVAIVENELTAIIGAAYYPGYIWLASEGLQPYDFEPYQALSGRNIVLYPNLSPNSHSFKTYTKLAVDIQRRLNCQVRVSSYLEDNATLNQRAEGLDIAYFLAHLREPISAQVSAKLDGSTMDSAPIRTSIADEPAFMPSSEASGTVNLTLTHD